MFDLALFLSGWLIVGVFYYAMVRMERRKP
jgi:preprotein translocase subunit YajC